MSMLDVHVRFYETSFISADLWVVALHLAPALCFSSRCTSEGKGPNLPLKIPQSLTSESDRSSLFP
jgi:hypothetical protein